MSWNLAKLIVSGAVELGVLALRKAGDFTSSYTPVMGALRERFGGIIDQTALAVISRVFGSYAAGQSYNSLQTPDALPNTPPIDLRPPLSAAYGAPPPNPVTGTNKKYTYIVDVATDMPNAAGDGFQSFPVTVTSSEQLAGDDLTNAAQISLDAFMQMLIDEYEREGMKSNPGISGINVISATLGYDFPPGWTI
jgi:hypothetical protein